MVLVLDVRATEAYFDISRICRISLYVILSTGVNENPELEREGNLRDLRGYFNHVLFSTAVKIQRCTLQRLFRLVILHSVSPMADVQLDEIGAATYHVEFLQQWNIERG